MPYAGVVKQFDRCCGIHVLHTFEKNIPPYTMEFLKSNYPNNFLRGGMWQDVKDAEQWLINYNKNYLAETQEQYLERIRKFIRDSVKSHGHISSYLLAVLNDIERNSLHDLFLEEGFQVLIDETLNPNSKRKITTYVLHTLSKDKQERKSVLS